MICSDGKRELLAQLLEAGLRVPPTLTGCKGYLLSDIEMFKMLLASGMDPNLPNWQRQTLLHDVCGGEAAVKSISSWLSPAFCWTQARTSRRKRRCIEPRH
jgi:hypothetical protein